MWKAGRHGGELFVNRCCSCHFAQDVYLNFRQKGMYLHGSLLLHHPCSFLPFHRRARLSTASKTNPGSVKYTLGRPDETVGPHLGISGA